MRKSLSVMLAAVVMASPFHRVEAGEMEQSLQAIQKEWAQIHYQTAEQEQVSALEALSKRAGALSAQYPQRAEPLVWEGIVLSTYAGAEGGLGALGLVEEAQKRLLRAEKISSEVLDGSIYTSLGSLYYQVPGWPIGFGDDEQAERYLLRALQLNPDGIDPNYFYGDFLLEQHRYQEAIEVLKHALQAPDRPNRPLADAGRRDEIRGKLARAEEQLSSRAESGNPFFQ